MVKEIATDGEFKEVINGNTAVIDFWAEWCMPCKLLAPTMDKLASKMKNITFAKVNIDNNNELAVQLGINVIPTLIIFKKGKEVDRVMGLVPEDELMKKLKKL